MLPYITIRIYTYGLMTALGVAISVSWLYYRSVKYEKYSICFKDFLLLCLYCVIGCVVGSKFLFTITQIPHILDNFSISKVIDYVIMGGFVFYGGLFGALLGNVVFSKTRHYDTNDIMDFTVPAFALFHFFGRIGCLLSGCCYGFRLTNPLIIGNLKFNYFPIQIVEALLELALFFILTKKAPTGKTLKVYLLSYSTFRFIIEFLRGDEERGIWFGLSTSQWISLAIIITYIFITIKQKSYGNKA